MSEHVLVTEQGPLVYQRLGEGAPRLALLPGWGLNASFLRTTALWMPLDAWAARCPTLVIDRRGAGGSCTNTGPFTPEQLAADLVAVLDDAGCGRVAVWAHADVCLAALAVAARLPERLAGLVLQAPFARLLAAPDSPHGMDGRAMLALAMLLPTAPVLDELDVMGTADAVESDGPARLRDTLAAGVLPGMLNDVAQVDARSLLPAVKVPALVMHGARDMAIPPQAGEAVARMLPSARIEMIDDMGHLPTPSQFQELLGRVRTFLDSDEHPG
jgi:pimeloyl-ACP methyl ester carboxylesterase